MNPLHSSSNPSIRPATGLALCGLALGLLLVSACKPDEKSKPAPAAPASSGAVTPAAPTTPATPPTPAAPAAERWKGDGISWIVPTHWQAGQAGGIRFATLTRDNINIAVTRFPGEVGGVLSNINRWRMQVGLPGVSEEDLPKQIEKVTTVDGAAMVVDFTGPDGKRMIAALLPDTPDNDRTWFFKMEGSRESLEGLKNDFIALIKSISFSAAGGSKI